MVDSTVRGFKDNPFLKQSKKKSTKNVNEISKPKPKPKPKPKAKVEPKSPAKSEPKSPQKTKSANKLPSNNNNTRSRGSSIKDRANMFDKMKATRGEYMAPKKKTVEIPKNIGKLDIKKTLSNKAPKIVKKASEPKPLKSETINKPKVTQRRKRGAKKININKLIGDDNGTTTSVKSTPKTVQQPKPKPTQKVVSPEPKPKPKPKPVEPKKVVKQPEPKPKPAPKKVDPPKTVDKSTPKPKPTPTTTDVETPKPKPKAIIKDEPKKVVKTVTPTKKVTEMDDDVSGLWDDSDDDLIDKTLNEIHEQQDRNDKKKDNTTESNTTTEAKTDTVAPPTTKPSNNDNNSELVSELKSKIEDLELKLKKGSLKNEELNGKIKDLMTELDTVKASNTNDDNSVIKAKNTKIAELNSTLESKENDLTFLNQRLDTLEVSYETKFNDKDKTIKDLKDKLATSTNTINDLKSKLKSKSNEILSFETDRNNIIESQNKLLLQVKDLQSNNNALTKKVQELETKLQSGNTAAKPEEKTEVKPKTEVVKKVSSPKGMFDEMNDDEDLFTKKDTQVTASKTNVLDRDETALFDDDDDVAPPKPKPKAKPETKQDITPKVDEIPKVATKTVLDDVDDDPLFSKPDIIQNVTKVTDETLFDDTDDDNNNDNNDNNLENNDNDDLLKYKKQVKPGDIPEDPNKNKVDDVWDDNENKNKNNESKHETKDDDDNDATNDDELKAIENEANELAKENANKNVNNSSQPKKVTTEVKPNKIAGGLFDSDDDDDDPFAIKNDAALISDKFKGDQDDIDDLFN